jgi:hypothetical protein
MLNPWPPRRALLCHPPCRLLVNITLPAHLRWLFFVVYTRTLIKYVCYAPYASSLHAFVSPLRFSLLRVSPSVLVHCAWRRSAYASCRDAMRLRFAFPSRSSATKVENQFRRRAAIASQPHALSVVTTCAVPCRPSPKSPVHAPLVPPCIYRQSCRVEGVLKLRLREAVSRGPFGVDAAPVHFALIWCLSERSLCRSCSLHRRLVARCWHSSLDVAAHVV